MADICTGATGEGQSAVGVWGSYVWFSIRLFCLVYLSVSVFLVFPRLLYLLIEEP